ncbi:M1 family metallopeptidase [Candidatus Saccharibacteria bacterium]|jgi:aminopeptidase N|nr:M1 family metallopeptidase [Candidatus Saccharibacteria bacterium]
MTTFSKLTESFTPKHYDLSLTLNREERFFNGTVVITGEFKGKDYLPLHSKQLEITSATINGEPADVATSDHDELHLNNDNLKPGDQIITLQFNGKITDAMHGLYPCYFEVDGKKQELLATQFESHHAREVFPCIDEPAAKATFDLTLTTEEGVTVLGNMPIEWQRAEPEGLVTKFETSPKMSSYLLAWVVGDLQKVTQKTKDGVEVNVWSTKAHPLSSLEFALDTGVRTIEFYNEYFDVDYPLPKCDHVALPDFSSGAMENWGLITYRETALLATKNTSISARRYIATVITHELSHQWFGNLVTMQWWDNLWLNESFATMMEYIAVDALYPEWNIWRDFASNESVMALRRDSLDGVQSVEVPVNHPDEISTLFDGAIVYAKGARLLRMLQHYIGHDDFRRGLKEYFKKYAYQNTVGENLWEELSKSSGKAIGPLMNSWISQPGLPVVTITQQKDGKSSLLEQEQFFIGPNKPAGRTWPIPLNSTDPNLPDLMESASVLVNTKKHFRLNDGDSAHFITRYQPDHLQTIIEEIASGKASEITRLQILHEQMLLAKSGHISAADLIPLLEAYQQESNETVWSMISLSITELKRIIEGDDKSEQKLRRLAAKLASKQFERLGWDRKEDESENDTALRAIVIGLMLYSEDQDVTNEAHRRFNQKPLENQDPELRAGLIANEIKLFDESGETLKSLLDRYSKETDGDIQSDIASGLTSSRDKDNIKLLLLSQKDAKIIRPQDVFRWFAYLMRNRYARSITWQWMQDEWSWISSQFSGDKSLDYFPRYSANALRTSQELSEYKKFFAKHKENQSLKRAINIGEGEIAGRIEQITRDAPQIANTLDKLN